MPACLQTVRSVEAFVAGALPHHHAVKTQRVGDAPVNLFLDDDLHRFHGASRADSEGCGPIIRSSG
jgi:hypothetical protein